MLEERDAPFHFPTPALWPQSISISIGEDPFEPALQDGREVTPVDRRDKDKSLGILHLLPLGDDVFGSAAVDKPGNRGCIHISKPERGNPALDRAACRVEDTLLQVHLIKDVQRHAFVNIAGKILGAENRVESNGIQIDDFIGMAGVFESFGELFKHCMAEGTAIGVSKYCQDFHSEISLLFSFTLFATLPFALNIAAFPLRIIIRKLYLGL